MWLTALILGFAGSMHCLGMCSPLVMAITSAKPQAIFKRTIYNTGRIFTYACLGALVASAGMIIPFYKFQNVISILLGLALLIIGLSGLSRIHLPHMTSVVSRLTTFLKNLFARQLKQKNGGSIFILGALNGLLPCGLTFIALTWCITLRGPLDGFNFMLLFGAGTLPVMLGFTALLPVLVKRLNWSIQKLTTSMLVLSGCILIARVFIVHLPHAASENGGIIDIILCG